MRPIYRVQNYRWEESADPIIEDLREFTNKVNAFKYGKDLAPIVGFTTQIEKVFFTEDGDIKDVDRLWDSGEFEGESVEGALIVSWNFEKYVGYARNFEEIGIAGEYPFHNLNTEADLITGNCESTYRTCYSIVLDKQELDRSSREEIEEEIEASHWKWSRFQSGRSFKISELLDKLDK